MYQQCASELRGLNKVGLKQEIPTNLKNLEHHTLARMKKKKKKKRSRVILQLQSDRKDVRISLQQFVYHVWLMCTFIPHSFLEYGCLLCPFIIRQLQGSTTSSRWSTEPSRYSSTYLWPLICQNGAEPGILQQLEKPITGFPLFLGHGAAYVLRIRLGDCHLRARHLLRCPWPVLSHCPHWSTSAFQGHHRPGEALWRAVWQHPCTQISRFFFRKCLHLQHVRHRHAEPSVQGVDLPLHFGRPLLCLPHA